MQAEGASGKQPDIYNPIYYSVVKRPYFRFHFPGLKDIQINHSQLHQDLFVLSVLNGKREGTYLDIGAHEPIFISNTALLEQGFGWRGLGLEWDPEMVAGHRRLRRNPCLQADALSIDYEACMAAAQLPDVIDYLSLDIDPPANTLTALTRLPHHKYRFRVITFEHDLSFGGEHARAASREILKALGYQLLVGDVSWAGHVVDDWWIEPTLTDQQTVSRMTPAVSTAGHRHDEYFYNSRIRIYRSTAADRSSDSQSSSAFADGICVEGWRGINHSYALVNQWQLLELLRHPVPLRHCDLPFYNSRWNTHSNNSGLPKELSERILHIPKPEPDEVFSIIYRIGCTLNLDAGAAERIIVFGTTEFGRCLEVQLAPGSSLSEAAGQPNLVLVTPSRWSKAGFVKSGFPEDRISIVPHGVAPSIFHPLQADIRSLHRQLLGLEDDDFALLNVSLLSSNKGIDLLIMAFANLKPRHPKLKLVIKDQSNLYNISFQTVLQEMASSGRMPSMRDSDWADIIPISANLDLGSLQALYNACDAYVSPYRAEGFNLPPLEAAACGLPIIVTAGGATDDYFRPELGLQVASSLRTQGEGEIYLEPDLEALQVAIEQLIAVPQRWGGEKASDLVHALHSWERVGDQLWDLLAGS